MNISDPKLPLGTWEDHLPLYVHVKVKIKFRSIIIFFVFNLGLFSISFVF